jgi:hypothetical protein
MLDARYEYLLPANVRAAARRLRNVSVTRGHEWDPLRISMESFGRPPSQIARVCAPEELDARSC